MPPLGVYWTSKDGRWKADILRDFLGFTQRLPKYEFTLYSFYESNTKMYVITGTGGRPISITDLTEGQRLIFGSQVVQTVFDVGRLAVPNDITTKIREIQAQEDPLPDFFSLPPLEWEEESDTESDTEDEIPDDKM